MIKIAVFSDTHNYVGRTKKFFDLARGCDAVFFLGDGLSSLKEMFTNEYGDRFYYVTGNNDSLVNNDLIVELGGKRFLLTHGNNYGVRYGLTRLSLKAEESGVDCVCYGHTHRPLVDYGNIIVVNPGTLGYKGQYAFITIEDDKIRVRLKVLES